VERLGVYLPTEHIDNPKGYGNGEDARNYDRRLRGPVDVCTVQFFIQVDLFPLNYLTQPRELEVDPRTGMKNYIANEYGPWDTSKALVRRTLERCVHIGRQYRSQGRKQDQYEAFRLLGQALHTLEDFTAHSNFCELALVSMGHSNVFVHVGDNVRIQAPNGRWVAPLVTGTFGSSDFLHSLLGEATDHLSEASVSDLNKAMDSARSRSMSGGSSPVDGLRDLLFKLPGGTGTEITREMEGVQRIRDAPAHGGKPPEQMSPQELHSVLWQVLSFRDSVAKKIENIIEKIPGLRPLLEKISDSISIFVLTTLEPFLRPIMSTATTSLIAASGEVINTQDQYEVFDNPHASDPSHSYLSKDHFNLILNEPAGNIAKLIVRNSVVLVTKAWDDNSVNPKSVADEILQCLFHPDFHDRSSQIQREMLGGMSAWLQALGHQQSMILARLSKQAVRDHKNVRLGGEGASHSTSTTSAGSQSGFLQGIPSLAQAQGLYNQFGGEPGGRRGENEPYGSYGPGGTIGSGTGPEVGPPAVPVYSRTGGGQADNFYGDAHSFLPQPYTSSYPGGPSSDAPPHSPGSHHGRGHEHGPTYGFTPPTQPGFAPPKQSSYLPPGSSYTEPGIPSPYTGGPPNTLGSHYPGSSYPGQSYPGQQGTGILGMPDPGNITPSYSSPQSNFPGTGPGLPSQGGRRFPEPQYDYGSGSGSGYGQGTYQPEY